jgi:hypothetical protein
MVRVNAGLRLWVCVVCLLLAGCGLPIAEIQAEERNLSSCQMPSCVASAGFLFRKLYSGEFPADPMDRENVTTFLGSANWSGEEVVRVSCAPGTHFGVGYAVDQTRPSTGSWQIGWDENWSFRGSDGIEHVGNRGQGVASTEGTFVHWSTLTVKGVWPFERMRFELLHDGKVVVSQKFRLEGCTADWGHDTRAEARYRKVPPSAGFFLPMAPLVQVAADPRRSRGFPPGVPGVDMPTLDR